MKMKNKELILILSPFFLFMGNLYAGTGSSSSAIVTVDQQRLATQHDTELTRRVRETINSDGSLSPAAKNVTIMTKGGQVTLSGAVSNADEKARVEQLTRGVTGNAPVSNQTVISK